MRIRRTIVKQTAITAIWITPVIQSILLPAHAQTSVCSNSDVVGEWGLAIRNPAMLGVEGYTLNAGGSGTFDGATLHWQTTHNKLIINLADGSIIDLQLFDNCNTVAGTISEQGGNTYDVSGSLNGFIN